MAELKAKLISVRNAATVLGVSVSGVYRLLKTDGFPQVVRTGKGARFYVDELEAWIDGRRDAAPGAGTAPPGAKKPLSGREHGFTARHDLYAAAALTGLLAAADFNPKAWIGKADEVAGVAHAIAEAMVSAKKSDAASA